MRNALSAGLVFAVACASGGTSGSRGYSVPGLYPPRDLADARPQTRAERSGFTETSSHADVVAFLDSLRAGDKVHVASLGRSSQGRDIPLVIASRPLVRSAAEAKRTNRPIVYIQGNIHGGEVEGKEALLSLLRDWTRDPYANALDSVVVIAVPLYNPDGNDAFGPQERNRGAQNGPASVGQRLNAHGLDLNRDYIKAEAPETQAALEMFRAWDPDVFIDLHTTNGSFHGYALTYAPPLNPAARFTGPFVRDTVLPVLRQNIRTRFRIETFPYGNFISQDSVERGWFTYDHRPRYGTNYYGLRGRVGILSEAYSHDPFRRRVASTYSFVAELVSIIANNVEDFVETGDDADRRTTAFASTPGSSPPIAIRSRITRSPHTEEMLVEDVVRTGDSLRTEPGLRPGLRRTGRVRTVRVPVFDRFEPVVEQPLPYAWIIPPGQMSVIEHLRRHGVFVEQVEAAGSVRAQRFIVDSVIRANNAAPGHGQHREVRLNGHWQGADTMSVAADAFVVRGAQPLGILALYLLEPQSDDGLVTWNFMDQWLSPGQPYPIARVTDRLAVPLRPVR